jgi:low affinity Fe/Cu permease
MPDWLVEGNPYVYFVLACAGAGLLYGWWRSRKPRLAIATGIVAVLILGFFLLDHFIESDREQMVRKIGEVADAVSMNDVDRAFLNVSEHFDHGGINKEAFRQYCRGVRGRGEVTEVKVWDQEVVDISRPAKTGAVAFRFKVVGSWGQSPPNYFARANLIQDPDGQWRIVNFNLYDAMNQSTTPLPIPGLGGR